MDEDSLRGLREELAAAFERDRQVQRHFDKLARVADVDERHLFFVIDYRKLPSTMGDALAHSELLPPDPPPVPEHVTHLWLAPDYSPRVLLWSRPSGWTSHPSYQ